MKDDTQAFIEAIEQNNFQKVIELVYDKKIDPNTCLTRDKRPVLHLALKLQLDRIAIFLLFSGANPNLTDAFGTTALMIAVQMRNLELITMLFQHHADDKIQTPLGDTAKSYIKQSDSELFGLFEANKNCIHSKDPVSEAVIYKL